MSKPAFTPGPWKWSITAITRGSKKGKDVRRHLWTGVPGSGIILTPSWSEFDGGLWEAWLGVGDANANLIAAGPDMYEALQLAQKYISHFKGGWSGHTPGNMNTSDVLDTIDAALAKAEGRS